MTEEIPIADDWLTEEQVEAVRKAVGPIPELTIIDCLFRNLGMCDESDCMCFRVLSLSPRDES